MRQFKETLSTIHDSPPNTSGTQQHHYPAAHDESHGRDVLKHAHNVNTFSGYAAMLPVCASRLKELTGSRVAAIAMYDAPSSPGDPRRWSIAGDLPKASDSMEVPSRTGT